ncbi:LamB/YcsF family protein [Motilibacter aurantiacus]|uniref:LamB/YcsF family protein n=1 Tax=Motilibacter aurantiacus TaxID=2714955 RepID=UPI002F2B6365
MQVDLNCDVGEGFGAWELGADDELLEVVTSANVACGFHAGDPSWMRRTCERAAERRVVIGAQVGFPDLQGFGRRHLEMTEIELADAVLFQIGALDAFARAAGSRVEYVKPHGALYHAAARRQDYAAGVLQGVLGFSSELAVVAPPGSLLGAAAADAGLAVAVEGFVDRRYTADGGLAPRSEPGAVLTDAAEIRRQTVGLATAGHRGPDGMTRVATLCVHSDTPGAAGVAREARQALADAGVEVRPFLPRAG